jgi:hypothetical protein
MEDKEILPIKQEGKIIDKWPEEEEEELEESTPDRTS